ncbi:MAG: hypothetical protein J6X72_03195, partial [Clostridia bacterium]|nr:hypothetical protein [Clostridia bacterium]
MVAYLTRYASHEVLMNGAINGAILENYIVSEIIKTYRNQAKEPAQTYPDSLSLL